MRGKFTEMKCYKYAESGELYFSKLVYTSDKKLILALFDYNKNSHHFNNYPYIFEGFQYDFYGEFEVINTRDDVVGEKPRHKVYFNITKLDDLKINS